MPAALPGSARPAAGAPRGLPVTLGQLFIVIALTIGSGVLEQMGDKAWSSSLFAAAAVIVALTGRRDDRP